MRGPLPARFLDEGKMPQMKGVLVTNHSSNLHFLGKLLEFVRFLYYYNNTILSGYLNIKLVEERFFLFYPNDNIG